MAELYFSIKSGLKNIIGKDLIIDDNIAVFELVKNSYDAHANHVVITFENNKIIIADDGKGMSYNDLINKWLAVAYSAKKDGTENIDDKIESEKRESYRDKISVRKFYAGAKGIGRFSCDRLGSKLILTTKKKGNPLEQLNINWEDFEVDQKENFDQVKIQHTTLNSYDLEFPNKSQHGTILEIENTAVWDREKIKELKHSIEKLINPFSETSDFSIEIVSERDKSVDNSGVDEKGREIIERDKINGKIANSILDILKLKTTQIDVIVKEDVIETKLTDRGTVVFHIKEKNKFNPFVDNLTIGLYYLNRSAKVNFTRKMGIEPINYGSIFLFKNGFRVQPYGNTGDDSWGLDFRSQQGYNRFLSSRDLFGRVDIITDNAIQFKEVSSRDAGLVETLGYKQLIDIFTKAHRRLERYVVGVLWGEAFKRNKYFNSEDEAQKFRDDLLKDKDQNDISVPKSNLGSKIDFIRLIKSLSDEKDVEILDFDKELVNVVNENLENVQPKFIQDLEKIAKSTGDSGLHKIIINTGDAFKQLEREKELAEKRVIEEERKRKEAEEKTKKVEVEKYHAEQKAKEEEKKRINAEFETEKKEKEKILAENERLKAEKKQKEEEEKRKQAEQKLDYVVSQKNFLQKDISDDTKNLESILHHIGLTTNLIKKDIENLVKAINSNASKDELQIIVKRLSQQNEKITSFSKYFKKVNFNIHSNKLDVDVISFTNEYIENVYKLRDDLRINRELLNVIINTPKGLEHKIKFNPIDMIIVLDNLISNSSKHRASKVELTWIKSETSIQLSFKDDGEGITDNILDNIFDFGFTTSRRGSGIGLYHVKEIIESLNGMIEVNNKLSKGVEFLITLKNNK